MALAQVQYTQSVAGNKNFSVPFGYISRDHIKVAVNGVDVTFTWTNASTISLTTAPVVGAIVDVRRETERNNLLVDFQDASTITENQLDLSARQAFFLAQEAFDATGGTLSVKSDGSYSASGRRIRDLGAPVSPNDATTKKWVQDSYHQGKDAYAAQLAAEAARDKAKKWADNGRNVAVETGKYSAKHHALEAAASATAAQTAESGAANSLATLQAAELVATTKADEAAASASAANTAKVAAQTAQTASETARSTAQSAATTATGARDTAKSYRDQALTYRDSASSHATNAGTAKDGAVAAEHNAKTYQTHAYNSAASATQSMNKAYNWAEAGVDFPVEPGKYSAKHHATKAAGSATASANSATASANSATDSANSAAEAAGYAAGVNLPSGLGAGGKYLRQNAGETGLEYADLQWAEIQSKPATATRWPAWGEVTGKPTTFPASSHNHDGRYVRADTGSTINVGRGDVYIENNSGDNINGAGITIRSSDNPSGGSPSSTGSILAVRSSGEALRLWVGQSVTSTGDNDFETVNISASGNITAYASDARLKENIEVIEDALAKVVSLRGVTYDWRDECEKLGFTPTQKHEHGVIAQEVEQVVPDAVAPAPFNQDYLTVRYDRLVPLLIEAIKELTQRIDNLEEKLNGTT